MHFDQSSVSCDSLEPTYRYHGYRLGVHHRVGEHLWREDVLAISHRTIGFLHSYTFVRGGVPHISGPPPIQLRRTATRGQALPVRANSTYSPAKYLCARS